MKLRMIVAVAAVAAAVALVGCPSNVRVYTPGANGGGPIVPDPDPPDPPGNGIALRADPARVIFPAGFAAGESRTFTIAGSNLELPNGTFAIGGTGDAPGGHAGRILPAGTAVGTPAAAGTPAAPGVPAVPATPAQAPFIAGPASAATMGTTVTQMGTFNVQGGVGSGVMTVAISAAGEDLLGGPRNAMEMKTLVFPAGRFGDGSPELAIELLFMPVEISYSAAFVDLAGRGIESRQPNPTQVRGTGTGEALRVPAAAMFDVPFARFDWREGEYDFVSIDFTVTENLCPRSPQNPVVIQVFELGTTPAQANANPPERAIVPVDPGTGAAAPGQLVFYPPPAPGAGAELHTVTLPRSAVLEHNGFSFRPDRSDANWEYSSQSFNFVISAVRFHD